MKTLKTLLSRSFLMIAFLCIAASIQSYAAKSENLKNSLSTSQNLKANLLSKKMVADSSDFTVYLPNDLGTTDWTIRFYGYDDDNNYINKEFKIAAGSYFVGRLPYGYYDIEVTYDNYNGNTEIDLSAYGIGNNLHSDYLLFFDYGSPNKTFHSVDLHSPYGIQFSYYNY